MRSLLFVIATAGLAAVLLNGANRDDLPEGKGREVLLKMCNNCHGIEQVTATQRPKKSWANLVDDMMSRGAEGSDADVSLLVGYLTRNFGKPVNINTSTAKQIEAGLSFTPEASEKLVLFRSDNGAFKKFEDLLKVPGLDAQLLDEQKKNIQF